MASLAALKAAEAQAEKDFTEYAEKPATDLHKRLAAWVVEKTEYDPSGAKSKAEAFLDGIRLCKFLQMEFQSSPENQAVLEERRLEKANAKAEAKEAKKAKKAKAVEADSEDTDNDAEETPAPAKTSGKKSKAKAAPVEEPEEDATEEDATEESEPEEKPAPATKRRPAKRAKASSNTAPF